MGNVPFLHESPTPKNKQTHKHTGWMLISWQLSIKMTTFLLYNRVHDNPAFWQMLTLHCRATTSWKWCQRKGEELKEKCDWTSVSIYWPGSRSSHTGHRGRYPGGSGPPAEFLHFGPVRPLWTRSADGPGRMTEGSVTPPSRSEGQIRLQTACGWPQQPISCAQKEWMLPLE